MSTREEFLENEIRTLNHHIQSMIDTMKVMLMNKQYMSDEIERLKSEVETAVKAEREACAKVCEEPIDLIQITDDCSEYVYKDHLDCAEAIRARGLQELNKEAEANGEEL